MRPCYVLRVFTDGTSGGNHLGVIADVTGLDDAGMQQIAADLGFSETVYLDWNDRDVPMVRIFTPAVELPFAGHPLVGTAWVLATMAPGELDHFECAVGEVRFGMAGDDAWIEVDAEAPVQPADDFDPAAARLPAATRGWYVDLGQRFRILELESAEVVAAAQPDFDALRSMRVTYVFSRDGSRVRARFFAPSVGIDEDPATGSAAVALAAVVRSLGEEQGSLSISQGTEIGMPCRISVSWSGSRARLAGTVIRDEVRFLDG